MEGEEGAMAGAIPSEAGGDAMELTTPQGMPPSGGLQNGMP
jgi:hypothetical protein